jgi:N-acyl-D-amino-acid deacylase
VPSLYYQQLEENMNFAMKQPFISFGPDGSALNIENARGTSPHPRAYGTYPRILGRYVRGHKVITLEEAVQSDIAQCR